jgi:hypothetical protein
LIDFIKDEASKPFMGSTFVNMGRIWANQGWVG